jgi:hypothetical protein
VTNWITWAIRLAVIWVLGACSAYFLLVGGGDVTGADQRTIVISGCVYAAATGVAALVVAARRRTQA